MVLENVNSPKDLKDLTIEQLNTLADETRREILSVIESNGGHLASNLGMVETTIALHRAFDFSKDKLIFDVGHQCYAHKILSDRKDKFSTIRTDGGLSGFPDREESVYDPFNVGHAGTSISAGLGFCTARDKNGDDYYVVNVVGDGSIINGVNLEAVTADTVKPKKYILVLNDNGMSISKNKNGFYKALSKSTTRGSYLKSKRALKKVFGNSFITRGLAGIRNFIKHIIGGKNFFENYGFKYVGVVDGNDIKELTKIIGRVKSLARDKAVFLHINTKKGKGYAQAEEHSSAYHGVGAKFSQGSGDFSVALGEKLNQLIEKDKKVVAITAGMEDGTGLCAVKTKNPKNFYDVGIAEEYAVTYAAGMAAGGIKPFVAIYSTFLQRSYDQIVHDVCLQNLPVTFCLDRAGLVGSDGKTHQGVFDLSYLTHVPNLTILAPTTPSELKEMVDYAYSLSSPVAIRYPKDSCGEREILPIKEGVWETLKTGEKATLLAVGPRMLKLALEFAKKHEGVGVVNARSVKPLCEKTLEQIKNTTVVTLEENSAIGGFGSLVRKHYFDKCEKVKTVCLGVEDKFITHGSVDNQLKENGLTIENLQKVLDFN